MPRPVTRSRRAGKTTTASETSSAPAAKAKHTSQTATASLSPEFTPLVSPDFTPPVSIASPEAVASAGVSIDTPEENHTAAAGLYEHGSPIQVTPPPTRSIRDEIAWCGTLTDAEILRVKAEVADFIVCPGYTSIFGKTADSGDRIFIPGALQGFPEVRRVFRKWSEKSQSEEGLFGWWIPYVEAKGIEPIRCHDILAGVSKARWDGYTRLYLRASRARKMARLRASKLEFAKQRKRELDALM